jgi:hypothetical protein
LREFRWAPLRRLDNFDKNIIHMYIFHTLCKHSEEYQHLKILQEHVAVAMGKGTRLNENLKATETHS